jgi:hypothetical protein
MGSTELTIFVPQVVAPVERQYINLGERYEEIKARLTELVESVKDVVITEEYLEGAAEVQKEVNKLYKEIEDARKAYHRMVDELFYDPIAEKIEAEIKSVYAEWENGFKKQKNEIEQQLLEKRIESVREWFVENALPAGLEWLTLEQAMQFGGVKITRKNRSKDIMTAINNFVNKVKDDIEILEAHYGAEEKAEYLNVFNVNEAVAIVKERAVAVAQAETVTPKEEEIVIDDEILTRTWEITGTKEQLVQLAKYAKSLGIEYKPLGGKIKC